MSPPLILAALWVLAAALAASLPSKRNHWPAAWALIATSVPILGYVAWQHGVWVGLLVLAAFASTLRWPLIYLIRWLRGN